MMKTLLLASALLVAGLSMVPAASATCMDDTLIHGDGCAPNPPGGLVQIDCDPHQLLFCTES